MCDLGGSGYCLWRLNRKVCKKSLGNNSNNSYCHYYVAALHFFEAVALLLLHATFCVMSEGL